MAKTDSGFEYRPDCRFFRGYKPCRFNRLCKGCDRYEPIGARVLVINLDGMGDVLMTTSMLRPLKRKYGDDSYITWITRKNAMPLLENNPDVDLVLEYSAEGCMIASNLHFDAVYNCDKSLNSCALLEQCKSTAEFGFGLSKFGTIVPVNKENSYNYTLGLNNDLKFNKNELTGPEILHTGMGLEYKHDPYILNMSKEEKAYIEKYTKQNNPDQKKVIGINTGCSPLYPNKKLSEEQYVRLCSMLQDNFPNVVVALVGGKAETKRNISISEQVPGIINTPTDKGLRNGIGFIDFCDVLISGDTLALHIGIARKKFVIPFFGVTCSQEIDVFNNGVKIVSRLDCSPCWKRHCDDPVCITDINLDRFVKAVELFLEKGGNRQYPDIDAE